MQKSNFRKYSILGQVGLWIILFLINFMEQLPYEPAFESFVYALNYVAMIAGIVYVHFYGALPLYLRGQKVLYFFTTTILIVFFSLVYYIIDSVLPFDYEYTSEENSWQYVVYDYLVIILIVAVSSLYYFVKEWFNQIQSEANLKTEKLQAELNFLKSQINPHFLFNTLNNIYSFAQTGNEKTAPMLERLSSILRFMVYDCNEEKVELNKEIHAVDDLLEIYKMKNSQQRNIQFSVEGVKGYHLVAPLIIVNFVENTFKHSDAVSNPEGFIHINISVDKDDICLCEISNSIKKKIKVKSPYQGVGLENVKKRLDLQYQDSYKIKETKKDNIYHVHLTIPLERKK